MVFSRLQEKLGSFGGVGCGLKICQLLLSIFNNLTRQRQTVQANSLIVQWNLVGCSTESTGVKLQRWWWVFLRSEYAFYQAVNVSTHIITPHTHTHTDNVCQVNCGHYLSKVTWGIIATATKVCHATLSNPLLLLSFPLPFPFHAQFILPFLFPCSKSSPSTPSVWMVSREKISLVMLQQQKGFVCV